MNRVLGTCKNRIVQRCNTTWKKNRREEKENRREEKGKRGKEKENNHN